MATPACTGPVAASEHHPDGRRGHRGQAGIAPAPLRAAAMCRTPVKCPGAGKKPKPLSPQDGSGVCGRKALCFSTASHQGDIPHGRLLAPLSPTAAPP